MTFARRRYQMVHNSVDVQLSLLGHLPPLPLPQETTLRSISGLLPINLSANSAQSAVPIGDASLI
jgi:hypothetical protein